MNLKTVLNREKLKLDDKVQELGCLNEETLKQSEKVDRLIVLKMREDLKNRFNGICKEA